MYSYTCNLCYFCQRYPADLFTKGLTNAFILFIFGSCHLSQYLVRPLWSPWRILVPLIEQREHILLLQVSLDPRYLIQLQNEIFGKEWLCLKKVNRTLMGKEKCLSFLKLKPVTFTILSLFLSFVCLSSLISCLVCPAACVQYPLKGPTSTSLRTARTAN